jgi:hypothetical protein
VTVKAKSILFTLIVCGLIFLGILVFYYLELLKIVEISKFNSGTFRNPIITVENGFKLLPQQTLEDYKNKNVLIYGYKVAKLPNRTNIIVTAKGLLLVGFHEQARFGCRYADQWTSDIPVTDRIIQESEYNSSYSEVKKNLNNKLFSINIYGVESFGITSNKIMVYSCSR